MYNESDKKYYDDMPPSDDERTAGDKVIDAILEFIETIVLAVFAMILVMTFVIKIVNVKGSSMESTLFGGDKLILSSFMYIPQQGDIVVINSEYMNETIIKRIIATGGQTVKIDYNSGTVSVNDELLSEPYINELMTDPMGFSGSSYYSRSSYDKNEGVYVYNVPVGSVFVMGDNRNHSTDSRIIGCVKSDEIIGKVVFRFYSSKGSIGRVK